MKILVFNAGSSSQKSRLYDIIDNTPDTPPAPLWAADADWTQKKGVAKLKITANGHKIIEERPIQARSDTIEQMLQTLWNGQFRLSPNLPILILLGIASCMEGHIIARASSSRQRLRPKLGASPHLRHCIILIT